MAMEPQVMVDRVSHTPVHAAAMAPERREFYITSDDRFIKACNLDTGQLLRTIDAHRGKITALVWVGSMRFVASTSLDHSLAVWSIKGECIARAKFPSAIYSAEFSTKYNAFIVGGVKKMFIVTLVQNRDDWDFVVDKEFCEHEDFISQILFTPLGRIFSCGYDGIICAFEQNVTEQLVVMTVGHGDHEVRARAKCHKGAITCAAFNTESGTLITGGYDMLVNIWNADSLTAHAQYIPLATLDLNKTILSLAYLQASRLVWVSTAGSHRPYVMDPRTGSNLTDFQPHVDLKEPMLGEHPTCLVATTAGTHEALSISDHKRLTIWRYNPLACVASMHAHTDWVEFLLPHPLSHHWGFVSGGADSTVRSWHSPSALYPQLYSQRHLYQGHQGSVVTGVIKEDGSVLFTAGDDMTIRAWALEDVGPAPRPAGSSAQENGEDGARVSKDDAAGPGAHAAAGPGAHAAAQPKEPVREEGAAAVRAASGSGEGNGEVGKESTATFLTEPAESAAPAAEPSAPAASLKHIGAGAEARYVRQGVPPAKPLVPSQKLLSKPAPSEPPASGGGGGNGAGNAAGSGGKANAADMGDACIMELQGHTGRITALCLLDHYLISVSADHSVRVWDSNTGTLWKTIEDAHESDITDVAASPANDTFCTVSADGLGYVWALETADLCGACRGHSAAVTNVVWVHEHSAWVTASDDSTLRMWDADGRADNMIKVYP
jgi:WD40 repeat protein